MDATLERTIRDRIETEKARTAPPPEAVPVPLIPTGRYVDPAMFALEEGSTGKHSNYSCELGSARRHALFGVVDEEAVDVGQR